MKFTVEVDDFYMDENSEGLEAELREYIIRSLTYQIGGRIEKQVEAQITQKVDEFVTARLSVIINDKLGQCIADGIIKDRNHHGKDVKIEDYIKNKFLHDSGWGSPENHINKIAKEFAVDLKAQYNTVFASKIVENIKEQGLLREDVAKILLGG